MDKFCDCVVGKMRGTYENIIRIISLIFVVTAIGGCGKSQQYQESTDFPKGMKTELTEQIKVNAEFQYPENCKMENVRRHRLVDRHSGISRKKLHNCWFRMVTLQMNT